MSQLCNICVNLYCGRLGNFVIGLVYMSCILSHPKVSNEVKCNWIQSEKKKKSELQRLQQYMEEHRFIYHNKVICTLRGISFSKPSCRSKITYCFILTGGLVKSFNKVDLIVLCKSLYRVHTSLYVCKFFNKVDLGVLVAPNRADHQKWSL